MSGTVHKAHLSLADLCLRSFAYCLVHTVQRPKVHGTKPAIDAPTIFVCRHVGFMDPLVLMVQYRRELIHPTVALDYYEKNGFVRRFYDHAQCIPIDRRNHSPQWLEDCLKVLERGENILIFPEGRRNKEGDDLLPFHTGAVRLALKSGAQIIPVFNSRWNFPHRYRLAIGEPFKLDPAPANVDNAWLHSQAEMMRRKVEALRF